MSEGTIPFVPPPSPEQQRALGITAAYLQRAGSQAATTLLSSGIETQPFGAALLDVRDQLAQAAAVCQMLMEVFDGWTFPPSR